jgi:hypothetical protein
MPFDVIYTNQKFTGELKFSEIVEKCPAVVTETASPETSGKYGFVNTLQAMKVLGDSGFRPVNVSQQPSRNPAKKPYAMHMLSFAHDDDLRNPYNETRPEIILYNSHDGKSALKLFAGAFRFICSNGIVAGDGFQSKMRHSNKTAHGFETLLTETAESLPRMMQRIATLQETETAANVLDFAYNAAKLRWEMAPNELAENAETGTYYDKNTIGDLLGARRDDDQGTNAWKVFNRVQENLMRGGPAILSLTNKAKETGQGWKYRKATGVSSLPETIRLNRELWDLSNALA